MRMLVLLAFVFMLLPSCATRRAATAFRVLPAKPDYLLRSPDTKDAPFPEVLGRYTNVGLDWVELRQQIELRVENAFFREGAPKRGLANFLGTEIVRYRMLPAGMLEQLSVESHLPERPADQPPIQQLLSEYQRRYLHHRLFYQVLVNKKSDVRSAVLLSAASMDELDRLTKQLLAEPDSVCDGVSTNCTAFPEACTASLEIGIVVNGAPRTVLWGSVLGGVTENHGRVELFRPYLGRLTPVEINPRDPEALRVPLLPGESSQVALMRRLEYGARNASSDAAKWGFQYFRSDITGKDSRPPRTGQTCANSIWKRPVASNSN